MKLSTISLAVAGVLLVASCNSTPVQPTSPPDETFPGCPDDTYEPLNGGESPTANTQRKPDSNVDQPDDSEINPGCTLPELDEK